MRRLVSVLTFHRHGALFFWGSPMRPDFQILADGKDTTATFRDRLISLRITDKAGLESDAVEVTLDDRDGAIDCRPQQADPRVPG